MEETGLTVSVKKLLYVNELIKPDENEHMVHFTFLCEPESDKVLVGNDPDHAQQVISDAQFINISKLVQMENFLPEIIRKRLLSDFNQKFSFGVIHLR